MRDRRYAFIAGGGTAGHVFVALATARALCRRGVGPDQIELVGSRRGQEAGLVGQEGFALTLLPGRGIVRRLALRPQLANLGALVGIAWATVRAVGILVRRRPQVVISVGGYASVPAGLAAVVLRIPLVLVNVDARPGLAHRLLGRVAAASAVAFPGTRLPHPVLTGAPVREDLAAVDHSPDGAARARRSLGLPAQRTTVTVFGGSLGARRLNEAALSLADIYRAREDLTLFHVTGPRNYEEVEAARSQRGLGAEGDQSGLCYRMVAFEEDMAALYGGADVVVCRAGALTVAELALVGVPAVLVPLPGAPGDHQSANAAALVDAGAAVMLKDDECVGPTLADMLNELLVDPARLLAMGRAAKTLGRPDAADAVATLVEAHAH
jgi:UDP-N-acetylglucosamine--N-acetylmuramyl-(pentapeptide) pyrophosphoryl-undecaprenol N-acetylglucosamine transferase